ncbi:MAG: hypothetical protein HY016_06740 [Nitrosomonadales bacterium]|nr:hypothetical protein [Nitrosomonadales bacterium]
MKKPNEKWLDDFRYNPIPPLLESGNRAIMLAAERDLLGKDCDVEKLWQLPEVQKILRQQKHNGSWAYPTGNANVRSQENYDQIETYRNLALLVEEYGLNNRHPAIQTAAEYLFSFQTKEGDIRGIYGDQYSPNYSAAITELLIKAGYENDARIQKLFRWLLGYSPENKKLQPRYHFRSHWEVPSHLRATATAGAARATEPCSR